MMDETIPPPVYQSEYVTRVTAGVKQQFDHLHALGLNIQGPNRNGFGWIVRLAPDSPRLDPLIAEGWYIYPFGSNTTLVRAPE